MFWYSSGVPFSRGKFHCSSLLSHGLLWSYDQDETSGSSYYPGLSLTSTGLGHFVRLNSCTVSSYQLWANHRQPTWEQLVSRAMGHHKDREIGLRSIQVGARTKLNVWVNAKLGNIRKNGANNRITIVLIVAGEWLKREESFRILVTYSFLKIYILKANMSPQVKQKAC